jgi:Cu-Zn family superoxide dismutase
MACKKGNRVKNIFAPLAVSLAVSGCAGMGLSGPTAMASLQPTKGSTVTGTVNFSRQGDKVLVVASVSGLKPGAHGFHIHEKGDCSSGDGMSAGGHFNPGGHPHGHHGTTTRHAGDMPNLETNSYGNATLTMELDTISIGQGPADILGRAVIVHVNQDDYVSQPVGNAGGRLACGVIQKS